MNLAGFVVFIKQCGFQLRVVADLPVGENLQDHIYTDGLEYFIKVQASMTEEKCRTLTSLADYMIFGQGDYAQRFTD